MKQTLIQPIGHHMGRRFKHEVLEYYRKELGEDSPEFLTLLEADDPVIWSENHLNHPDTGESGFIVKDMFRAFLRSNARDRALRVGRQIGKCEAWSTRIQLADGSWPTARELYEKVGDAPFTILTTDQRTLRHLPASAYIRDNGCKPLVKVTTASGHVTRNTDNHPYLALVDDMTTPCWIEGQDLRVGDRIAVTRTLAACMSPSLLSTDEAELLGYLVGDGTCQHTTTFTTADPELVDRINILLGRLAANMALRHLDGYEYSFTVCDRTGQEGRTSWIADFTQRHGLTDSCSCTTRVPASLFQSDQAAIAAFLGAYWSMNGWVCTDHRPEAGTSSASEMLTVEIRALLLRLGILAQAYPKEGIHRETTQKAWQLLVVDTPSLTRFAQMIPIVHVLKREQLAHLPAHHHQSTTDIYWDVVTSVDTVGDEQTYAITVPSTATLITDHFITHNTVHLIVDYMHVAATNRNRIILIFTPQKKQMNRMLDIMKNLLMNSDLSQSFSMRKPKRTGTVKAEYDYEITVSSGSVIRFFFMDTNPDKARGQMGTDIYVDEAEYLSAKAYGVITGITKRDPSIHLTADSTPSGVEGTWFWKFSNMCQRPTNTSGSEFHLPTTLEPNWPEIEERLRNVIFDDVTWALEVLAEWAEPKGSVYKKEFIDLALERASLGSFYPTAEELRDVAEYQHAPKWLGVDWNTPQNGVRLVELASMYGLLWVTRNERISYENYTQLGAVERIMELYREHRYETVTVDEGYGAAQVESLLKQLAGLVDGPVTDTLIVVDSSRKEKVMIEYTSTAVGARRRQEIVVRTKTQLVSILGTMLENTLAIPKDEDCELGLVRELRVFRRKEAAKDGSGFLYTGNSHSLSALQLCAYGRNRAIRDREHNENASLGEMSSTDFVRSIGERRRTVEQMAALHQGSLFGTRSTSRMGGFDGRHSRLHI
jgi:intein/homing endonuclease